MRALAVVAALSLAAACGSNVGGGGLKAQARQACVQATMLDMAGLPAGTPQAAQRQCDCTMGVMESVLTPEEFTFVANNIVATSRGGGQPGEAQMAIFENPEARARMKMVGDRVSDECYQMNLIVTPAQ